MSQILSKEVEVNLDSFEFYQNPYPILEFLRKNHPVYQIEPNIWLLTDYNDCVNIIKSPNVGKDFLSNIKIRYGESVTKEPVIQSINRFMLVKNPPEHTSIRSTVSKAFTPKMLRKLKSFMEKKAELLINNLLIENNEVDILKQFAHPFSTSVICEMLGFNEKEGISFFTEINSISKLNELRILSNDEIQEANQALYRLQSFFEKVCINKTKYPKDDLITALLKIKDEHSSFSNDDILANIILLFIAGHETTVNLITNGVYSLLKNPIQFNKLKNSPCLIKSTISEILRFESSVQMISRNVFNDFNIRGTSIKKDDIIYLSLGSANYDPKKFKEPYYFDITREPNKHLSFGGGIHYCLGAMLSKLETEIAITTLIKRIPNVKLKENSKYKWKQNITLRGLTCLTVTIK